MTQPRARRRKAPDVVAAVPADDASWLTLKGTAIEVVLFIGVFALVYAYLGKAHFTFSDDPIDPVLFSAMMTSGGHFGASVPSTPLGKAVVLVHLLMTSIGAVLIVAAIIAKMPPRLRPVTNA